MCNLVVNAMADDTDIYSLPLTLLPYKTKKLLSCLLNSTKIIPCDGPDRLPRDWRGLACLVNISSEVAASFQQFSDKTSKVLDVWLQDPTVTVGTLLEYMQRLDRYDVHDDILNDLREYVARGELVVNLPYPVVVNNNNQLPQINEDYVGPITEDDRPGYEHRYHAFVLYADADKDFVDEMFERLGNGFQLCTKEKLLPGHATEYAPVAQLISQRCQYIVLVYSPDFLMSPANTFYRDYAQAVSIESKQHCFQRKIIPIMYKECQLPLHLMYYHKLYFKKEGRAMYNFWEKLRQSLGQNRIMPGINGATSSSHSEVNITELPSSNGTIPDGHFFLAPEKLRSISTNGIDSLATIKSDDELMTTISQISDNVIEKKKKKGPIKWVIDKVKNRKKGKGNEIALTCQSDR